MKPVNFEAYFLGPKGENADFYRKLLLEALDNHVTWRKSFHYRDTENFITDEDKGRKDFIDSRERIQNTLYTLMELLKSNQPFFSPRYIGHMNWEVMMAPIISYFATALYNPNNVAQAGSTGTSELELQVGKDFCRLFGFDENKAWGHICTGGTIANIEALWIARNMKLIPSVLKRVLVNISDKERLDGKDNDLLFIEKEKLQINEDINYLFQTEDKVLTQQYNPIEVLDLKDRVIAFLKDILSEDEKLKIDDEFDTLCMQEQGCEWNTEYVDTGVVFLPQTKHYSLKKALDLLGIGRKKARYIPVDKDFKMNIPELKKQIEEENGPILAVVGVIGSTEESAVDKIHEIIKLRDEVKKTQNKGFHIHIDAAYGGYVRSMFLDEDGQFMNRKRLEENLEKFDIIGDKPERKSVTWPSDSVYESFNAFPQTDTITVDPHKLGYVLYPAGGIAMRDRRMREAIHTFAPYVFKKPKPNEPDTLIGSYILEGSKPGAAAAAVWTAHKIMPLNITGYGKLIGETIDGAQALYWGLKNANTFKVTPEIKVKSRPVIKPDINIVNYVFYFEESNTLQKMNELTEYIATSILGPDPIKNKLLLEKSFIVSSTEFSEEEYGDSPLKFLHQIDIEKEEWDKIQIVKVIRSVVMSPYLTVDYVDENYVNKFIEKIQEELVLHQEEITRIYKSENV